MSQEPNQEDYLWIITETKDQDVIIVGMSAEDSDQFIPATPKKEDALVLMGRLPAGQNGERQVEAMHKERLLAQAAEDGYRVFVVDMNGVILQRLTPAPQ